MMESSRTERKNSVEQEPVNGVADSASAQAKGNKQTRPQRNNPLHGMTLQAMVTALQAQYGWEGLAEKTRMHCFQSHPSLKSSLTFLRRTPWAREKIEQLYLFSLREKQRAKTPSRSDY